MRFSCGTALALADLAPWAGDLPAVKIDAEVVPVEAFVPAVLVGGITRQRPADGDLVFALGSFQVDQRGVAAVHRTRDVLAAARGTAPYPVLLRHGRCRSVTNVFGNGSRSV